MSAQLEDVVIVIPGITGSALEKNGQRVWDVHGDMLWRMVRGTLLPGIQLPKSTPGPADDGVRATRLIEVPWAVTGVMQAKGYGEVRALLATSFELVDFDPKQPAAPANFAEFPYDWRLDNRVAARKLRVFIEERVQARRERCPRARAVLLAHSMGGLVSLHALEVYGGWQYCRSLITLGTPFLGAPKSLCQLINGYQLLGLDASEALRSFPSVYQLLPTYPCIADGDANRLVYDMMDELGLDRSLTENARSFHQELIASFDANQAVAEYRTNGYYLQPITGIFQPTVQSLGWKNGVGTPLATLPADLARTIADGDGTVPRISSSFGSRGLGRTTFLPERHSYLQANPQLFTDLIARLQAISTGALPDYLGELPVVQAGIAVDPPENVVVGARPRVHVAVQGVQGSTELVCELRRIAEDSDSETLVSERTVAATDAPAAVDFDPLARGLYSLRVVPRSPLSQLQPVHDLLVCDDASPP